MSEAVITDEDGLVVRVEADEVITEGDERHGTHGVVEGPRNILADRFAKDEKPAKAAPKSKAKSSDE